MGSFFLDLLSFEHETAVYEKDPMRMRFTYNCQRFTQLDEIKEFNPDLVINAVTVKYTVSAFKEVLPSLRPDCIISDISSVKTGLKAFYATTGHPYVSTHPMFGPTFANLNQLSEENFRGIADIMLSELRQSLESRGIDFTWDESVKDYLVKKSYSVAYGARNLRRAIQTDLEDPIAERIIRSYVEPFRSIKATCEDGKIRIETL